MEAYAGFAEHTDAQVGRLIEALEEMGKYEDTLFIYLAGDNGASAEGGLDGTFNELMALNGIPQVLEDVLPRLDEIGSPTSFNHYPVGWAHAMNTPFQYTKQVASHYGGTRNALAMSWPNGINARGEIRDQWHHVIDIVPTMLDAAGLPEPYLVNGSAQKPIEGVSMEYTWDDPDAESTHHTQYFEIFGNRGYLPGRVDGGDASQHTVAEARLALVRRRRLGALRHEHGLEPSPRPLQGDAGEAPRDAVPVHDRGGQVRTCSRSTTGSTNASTPQRPADPTCRRSDHDDVLPGDGHPDGEHGAEREEPFTHR